MTVLWAVISVVSKSCENRANRLLYLFLGRLQGRLFLFGEVDVDHVAVFRLTAEALSWLSRKSR